MKELFPRLSCEGDDNLFTPHTWLTVMFVKNLTYLLVRMLWPYHSKGQVEPVPFSKHLHRHIIVEQIRATL